jgi:hypothetical protein
MKGLTDACAVAKGGLRDSVAIELLVARSGSPGGGAAESTPTATMQKPGVAGLVWARPGSVEVERCADRVGEAGFLVIQEPTDLIAERGRGNRRDVIARDNAPIFETVRGAQFDFS